VDAVTDTVGRVVRLRIAPVKGLALVEREAIELGPEGVAEDRRFVLLGPDGRHRSGLAHGPLVRIVPDYDAASERLTLRFPDGETITADALGKGDPIEMPWPYGGGAVTVLHVPAFDRALTAYVGMPMRLARTLPGERPSSAHVTILSVASVEALERGADLPEAIDDRRFGMLVTVDGVPPFAESGWVGGEVALGDAVVRVDEEAARCATTTRDPSTGLRDIDMLRVLRDVRGVTPRKTVDLGIYCDVVRPGRVAVGDEVRPRRAASVA
jgi:uncharacterized protein YcbX